MSNFRGIATKTIRNTMIWAAAGFFLTYYAGLMLLDIMNVGENYPVIAFHILLAAYFVHLIIRTIHLTVQYRRKILSAVI